MTDSNSPDDTTAALSRDVRDHLEAREDVTGFDIQPAETGGGILATVETESSTEHYHVTIEEHSDSTTKLHWAFIGEEERNQLS